VTHADPAAIADCGTCAAEAVNDAYFFNGIHIEVNPTPPSTWKGVEADVFLSSGDCDCNGQTTAVCEAHFSVTVKMASGSTVCLPYHHTTEDCSNSQPCNQWQCCYTSYTGESWMIDDDTQAAHWGDGGQLRYDLFPPWAPPECNPPEYFATVFFAWNCNPCSTPPQDPGD
jgi:hypothetical protein